MTIPAVIANSKRQKNNPTDLQVTSSLSGTASQIITLNIVAKQISMQMAGSLVGTVTFSLDGVQFTASQAIGSVGTITNYSTSLVKAIKVTASSGTGTLTIAAV